MAERYLNTKAVDWKKAERTCFNEWSNPDDDELGLQIVRVSFFDTGTTYKVFPPIFGKPLDSNHFLKFQTAACSTFFCFQPKQTLPTFR